MNHQGATPWSFHCGVCAKQLTDATALFTSCGHFFCFAPGATCTRLKAGDGAGRCEICGNQCDSGHLANQGIRYDSRVRSFVFSDLAKDLRNIAEIIGFRNNHLQILGENAAEQQKRIHALTAECKSRREENEELRRENKTLRIELSRHKNKNQQMTSRKDMLPPRTYERDDSDEVGVNELDPPTRSKVMHSSKRRETAHESLRMNRGSEPSYAARGMSGMTHEPSLALKSTSKRRESHVATRNVRDSLRGPQKDHRSGMKRRWGDRSGTEGAYGSSKVARKDIVSRFGYPSGESRGRDYETKKVGQRFGGDWQRKVSSVPRPSATPHKLRRRGRRSAMDVNPLGTRY